MTQPALLDRFVPSQLPASQDSSAAYERVLPKMLALADSALLTVARDNHAIAGVVLRALASIKAQRPLIEKHFRAFDFTQIDELEDYANAARQAQSAFSVSVNSPDELVDLMPRAVQLRDLLAHDAEGLVKRGKLATKLLDDLRGANGYQNVAHDLLLLVNTFKAAWASCSERVSIADRDEAQALGDHVFYLIHQREKAETRQQDAGLRRQQAYTLLVNAYACVRLALAYAFFVEGAGEVDEVAPSMFTFSLGTKKATSGGDGTAAVDGKKKSAKSGEKKGEQGSEAAGQTEAEEAEEETSEPDIARGPTANNIPAGLRVPFER
jgi:hypothetical protein